MASTQRNDPYTSFNFRVEIEGIASAVFSEVSGLASETAVIEYRLGGEPNTVRKLPGKASYPDISLKWGITDSRELYDWHLTAINGKVQRKNGSVILQDDAGQEKIRWNFFAAWPSKYKGPDFNAKGNDVAIDNLTVSCERLERA